MISKSKANRLRADLARLNGTLRQVEERLDKVTKQRDEIAQRLKTCENNEIKWTDHGVVRYLERVRKTPIDTEALLAEVVTDDLQELVDKLGGTGRFPTETCVVVLKDHHIVTILERTGKCENSGK